MKLRAVDVNSPGQVSFILDILDIVSQITQRIGDGASDENREQTREHNGDKDATDNRDHGIGRSFYGIFFTRRHEVGFSSNKGRDLTAELVEVLLTSGLSN